MAKFVIFLRGINVGGNKKVPMKDLKDLFAELGFENIKTILASGNAVFESSLSKEELEKCIPTALEERFGFAVPIQVRSFEDVSNMIKENPFKNLKKDENIYFYVTFLNKFDGSVPVEDNDFDLFSIQNNVLFSSFDKSQKKSTDFMTFLDKTFGKEVTTRNWNTILKIADL